jgi:hypothetical protein
VRRAWLAALPLLSGCAYYNAMWRAEQYAKEARGMEARGRAVEARIAWARATTKAESVLARHPGSRWADDALVLKGEGLARSGDCAAAEGPLEEARRTIVAPALVERASLAAAECALLAGNPFRAARLAGDVAGSRDADRRARAAYLEGRAAWARGDAALALDRYARSGLAGAALARARALLELGRVPDALDQIADVDGRAVPAAEWTALIDAVARAAGPETASLALDRVLAAAPLTAGARGRLLVADGDRLRAAGLMDAAAARYRAVRDQVPDSAEGAVAVVRLARTRAAQATDTAAVRAVLSGLGREPEDARSLAALLRRVLGPHPDFAGAFGAAEAARDSLGAGPLAGALFLGLARRFPESIFAPKALVAALALDAEPRDSILGVLRAAYPSSPYTLALAGAAGPAYAVAEDSLAQALGLDVSAPVAATPGRGVPAPVPGARGPFLDVVFRAPAGGEAATVPDPERPPVRDRERVR